MNWAFYSTLSRPLKQPDTVGGDRREEGSRVRPATWQRVGRRTGEPEEQAGHPRPAREAGRPSRGQPGLGLPLPWSRGGAGARPVRRGGPRCQGLSGGRERRLHWLDDAFASGDARFSPGWARRKSPECSRPLSAPPPTVWSGPFLQREALVHFLLFWFASFCTDLVSQGG